MKAPSFWGDARPGVKARLLTPAAALFALGGWVRRRSSAPMRPPVPVICVGNVVVGGAGKTPTTLAICERLTALGAAPHILSRGYGGRVAGPHRVDPARDRAEAVGDEAVLMARRWPVWVGEDRRASAASAVADGADILVMDDGFQNPGLTKDLSFLVIDAAYGHGNGLVMPAGPLREPLSWAFARADAAIMVGDRPGGGAWPWTPPTLPVLRARISATSGAEALRDRPVVAFAGIGRPEKFFRTLRQMGARVLETIALDDHQPFNAALLARIEARADSLGAELATTEKDAVRLPAAFLPRVRVVAVTLGFANSAAIDALLRPVVAQVASGWALGR